MASAWGKAWGLAWGSAWGSVGDGPQPEIKPDVIPLGGGGYDFLDPEYHKKRIPRKVKKLVRELSQKIVATPQKYAEKPQDGPTSVDYTRALLRVLEAEQIAYSRAYDELLQRLVNARLLEQIRLQLEINGVYRQIQMDEDDERALMLLFMEL